MDHPATVVSARFCVGVRSATWELTLSCGHMRRDSVNWKNGKPVGRKPVKADVRPAPKSIKSCAKCFTAEFWHQSRGVAL